MGNKITLSKLGSDLFSYSSRIVHMNGYNKTYLIGAGFSRSFSNDYPLSCDFFAKMREKKVGGKRFIHLNPSLENIDRFLERFFPFEPDLEEVLSFLTQKYFPQDFRQHWQHRDDVYQELLWNIPNFLSYAKPRSPEVSELLARFCNLLVSEMANIVTFNYDCLLDQELLNQGKWNPSSGYGSPMRHMINALSLQGASKEIEVSKVSLLKLHGSINWGTAALEDADSQAEIFYNSPNNSDTQNIGQIGVSQTTESMPPTVSLTPFMHKGVSSQTTESMPLNLSFTPFIIPPILDKTGYYGNKFLRRLWFFAHECLAFSEEIVIIGYSFPETDYFARFLIREAFGAHLAQLMHNKRKVTIVNLRCDDALMKRARQIFGDTKIEFIEKDAFGYIADTVSGS